MGRLIKIIVIVLVCNVANETNVINVGRRQICYFVMCYLLCMQYFAKVVESLSVEHGRLFYTRTGR